MHASLLWFQRYRLNLSLLFICVLLPLFLFGHMANEVMEQESFFFDAPVLLYLHSHANAAFDALMLFFTRAGSAAFLAPFDVLIWLRLLRQRERLNAVFWSMAVGGAALLNVSAKHLYGRIRPDLWVSVVHETSYSFPSGHAMHSMAVVAALTSLTWRTRWRLPMIGTGIIFVSLVGLSRAYFGVHFPSDILAGWAASLAWVTGLYFILKPNRTPLHE